MSARDRTIPILAGIVAVAVGVVVSLVLIAVMVWSLRQLGAPV